MNMQDLSKHVKDIKMNYPTRYSRDMNVLYLFDDKNSDIMFDYAEAERVIQMAKEKLDPELMIVFGSVAGGTANKDSDLDIIIVKESDENMLIRSAKARRALKGSKVPIDIIVYTPDEFEFRLTSKYSLPSEALATGRIVHGSV